MEFIKNIFNYFNNTEQVNDSLSEDNNSLELIDFDECSEKNKYNEIHKIIDSNAILNLHCPKKLYKDNGILDINEAKVFYKKYTNEYYKHNIKDYQIENIFTNFFIINNDNIILKYHLNN